MKNFFILICLIFSVLPSEAKISFTPLVPYQTNNSASNNNQQYNTVAPKDYGNYPKVDMVEQKLFHKTFRNEDINLRLSRIEVQIFSRNYPNMSLADRMENIISRVGFDRYADISQRELAIMEQRIFMKTYPKDSVEMRIVRLEKEIFGAMQGGDLNTRYDVLRTATKYYNAYPHKLSNQIPYYSNPYYESVQPPSKTPRSIIKGLGNFLFSPGSLTGYSPAIPDYTYIAPNYSLPYGNPYNIVYPNNYNYLSPPNGIRKTITGNGINSDIFRHYSTGSSVHIID